MSLQEINQRSVAVKTADAINAIEGVPVSKAALRLSERWAKGEITGGQMKAAILARYQEKSSLNALPR